MQEKDSPAPPDPRNPPRTPRHPGDDAVMPPYTPGGVPSPENDGRPPGRPEEGEKPPTTLPPKRDP